MHRCIAFLRAINVGGRIVKMDALKREFESLGLKRVETFIASGNVIFESSANAASLESKIEKHLAAKLGYEVATFLRTPAEVQSIATYQPFNATAMKNCGALVVGFVRAPLVAQSIGLVNALKSNIDDFHVNGREVYWICKTKQSESKFSNAVFERTLRAQATFRGMNTVKKLAEKYVAGK